MMNNRFGLHFYFKKPKRNSLSTLPIYLRISASAERAEIATQRRWDPSRWNASAGRATGKGEDARALNAYLDTLQAQVYEAHRQLIADREEITADAIKMRATGRREKGRMFIEIFKEHNSKLVKLVEKGDSAPGTLMKYETTLVHTASFLQWKYKTDDIEIDDLNYEFVSELEYWLKTEQGCSHNTAVKYISFLRKIVNLCLRNGWILRDPFLGYKANKREVIRQVLTPAEIETLINKSFGIERLSVIRDLFVFSCFTGLAYADVKKLKRTEIGIGLDDKDWIFTYRKKSDVPSHIPLLPEANRILQLYQNHPMCVNKGCALTGAKQSKNECLSKRDC